MTDDWSARFVAAQANLTRVLSLAPNHAWAHMFLGLVRMYTKRAAQGIADCEQALALDRNLAAAHGLIGLAKYFLGRGAETEAHIHEALRLSPRDVFVSRWMIYAGLGKLQVGADADAVVRFRRGIETNRNYPINHFLFAAALAQLGSLYEARAAAQEGLTLDPHFTIRRYRDVTSAWSDNPTYRAGRERLAEGMRMAGVPEG